MVNAEAPKTPMSKGASNRVSLPLTQSQLGIVCALAITLLCALRSVLYHFVPHFHRFRLWNSWAAPRWHTIWLYVLFTVVAFWFAHSMFRLLKSIGAQTQIRLPWVQSRGLAVAQLSVVIGFGAYLWFVVRPASETFMVTDKGTDIHGEFFRALRIEMSEKGELRKWPTAVWLERRVGTVTKPFRVARGSTFSSTNGKYQLMVARARMTEDGAIFRRGHRHIELSTSKTTQEGDEAFLFRGPRNGHRGHQDEVPHAEFRRGHEQRLVPLDPEWAGENALLGLRESPVCMLRVHRNLGVPLAISAAWMLSFALLLGVLSRDASRRAK